MAENSYVFYYYPDKDGQRIVELRLVNVSTGNVTTLWTVSTTGTSFTQSTIFEVRGAAYDATDGTLYTLIKYTETGGIIHYRLAETLNFSPATTNEILLDSNGYGDMNLGPYFDKTFCNLTIVTRTTADGQYGEYIGSLLCGDINGYVYQINPDGSIFQTFVINQNNDEGTVVALDIFTLYGVYNNGTYDYINTYYGTQINTIIRSSIYPTTSVAYNILDDKIYYYNINTQLSVTTQIPDTFNDQTIVTASTVGDTLNFQDTKNYDNPILFFGPIACIHSSSKVLLSDGSYKLITNVTSGDQVYSPDCKTAIVKEVVPCWLKVPNNPFHKCVVFEKDSLAPNVPSELFIIDPGHPMSFATNYDNHGLRSAKEYVNGKTIYMSDYNDVKEMFPDDMKHNRYDLVLNRGDTYVANNVIVKSRTSFKTAGYDLDVD